MPISDLPHELLLEIFSYYPRYDPFHTPPLIGATDHFGNSHLHRFSTVCRSWRIAVFEYIYETLPIGILPEHSESKDQNEYFDTLLLLYGPSSDFRSFQHAPLVRSIYIHLDAFEESERVVQHLNKFISIAKNCVDLRKIIISAGTMDYFPEQLTHVESLLSILCAALAELPLKHVDDLEFSLFEFHGSNGHRPRDNLQSESMPKGISTLLDKLAPRLKRFQADFAISSAAISTFVEKSAKSKILRHLGWRFINNDGSKRLRAQLENLSTLTSLDLCHAMCDSTHWHRLLKKISSVKPHLESLAIGARDRLPSEADEHPRAAESIITTLCQTLGNTLRRLDVSGNIHLGDKWWHAVLDGCPNLEVLNMAHTRVLERVVWMAPDMADAVKQASSKPRLPRLVFLNVYSWTGLNEALILRIARDAPKAKYLWEPGTTEWAPRYTGELLVNQWEMPHVEDGDFLRAYEDGMQEDIDIRLFVEVGFVSWQIKAILDSIDKAHRMDTPDQSHRGDPEYNDDDEPEDHHLARRSEDLHLRESIVVRQRPGQYDWAQEVNWEALGLWYPFYSWGEGRRRYNLESDPLDVWDDHDDEMDLYISDEDWGDEMEELSDEGDESDDGFQTRFDDEWQTTDEEAE